MDNTVFQCLAVQDQIYGVQAALTLSGGGHCVGVIEHASRYVHP